MFEERSIFFFSNFFFFCINGSFFLFLERYVYLTPTFWCLNIFTSLGINRWFYTKEQLLWKPKSAKAPLPDSFFYIYIFFNSVFFKKKGVFSFFFHNFMCVCVFYVLIVESIYIFIFSFSPSFQRCFSFSFFFNLGWNAWNVLKSCCCYKSYQKRTFTVAFLPPFSFRLKILEEYIFFSPFHIM